MRKSILAALAALFALAVPGSAGALESGATCDDYEDGLEQTVVDGEAPVPDPSPAPGA